MTAPNDNAQAATAPPESSDPPAEPGQQASQEDAGSPSEPAAGSEPGDTSATPGDGEQAERSGNAEAQRYRLRLRETEAERDRLSGLVDDLHLEQIDRLARANGLAAKALLAHTPLGELRDPETGHVSTERVAAAIEATREDFGLNKPLRRWPNTGQGRTGPPSPGGSTFRDLLDEHRR